MKAIILAGGLGLRLREIIKDVPKPMAAIAGKPFLEYLILQLFRCNITEIVLSIGYKGDVIKSYFGNGQRWGVKIAYSEEHEPLGTGGALRLAIKLVTDRQFVVMNGDSFFDVNINDVISFHNKQLAMATIGLVNVNNTSRYGKVEINEKYEVIKFSEKGMIKSGLINSGIYIFTRDVVDYIPDGKVSLESVVLHRLIARGLYGMIVKSFFVDIGVAQDYLALCSDPWRLVNLGGYDSDKRKFL